MGDKYSNHFLKLNLVYGLFFGLIIGVFYSLVFGICVFPLIIAFHFVILWYFISYFIFYDWPFSNIYCCILIFTLTSITQLIAFITSNPKFSMFDFVVSVILLFIMSIIILIKYFKIDDEEVICL